MTLVEIEHLKQTIASTPKASRPFIFEQPVAPGDDIQKSITLISTKPFGGQQFLTPLASAEYWKLNFADWVNKMDQAKQYCIIYNADLIEKEM